MEEEVVRHYGGANEGNGGEEAADRQARHKAGEHRAEVRPGDEDAAGEGEADSYNRELIIEGLGSAWALPGLELLMDEPERKRELWQAMRRVMQRWKPTV